MTLFGLAMEQVFACDGMGVQFGSMGFLSCRAAAFLNQTLHTDSLKLADELPVLRNDLKIRKSI